MTAAPRTRTLGLGGELCGPAGVPAAVPWVLSRPGVRKDVWVRFPATRRPPAGRTKVHRCSGLRTTVPLFAAGPAGGGARSDNAMHR